MAPRTREELLALGQRDPALEAELKANPIRDPQPSDPYYGRTDHTLMREHRAQHLREKHHLRYIPDAVPEVQERDHAVATRDGAAITVRVYTPVAKPARGSALVVMYHEGGFYAGDLSDEEVNCRMFARDLGAVCVNVDYRLAPEHRFPTGINDCWDALQWAADNATTTLGATPARGFIIGGGSAGGNITAVLAHLARDAGLTPVLTGQYLCVPAIMCFLAPEDVPEAYRAEYLSHPAVTPSVDPVLAFEQADIDNLVQGIVGGDLRDERLVPFHFGRKPGGHRGVPPAYLQVCGIDPLRDEALIYERVLREEAGVKTRLDVYPGLGHYFWTNYPRLEMSKKFVEDTREGVRWLLEQSR